MLYAGEPFTYYLDFSTDIPVGAVTYSVLGNDNIAITGLDNLTVTPASGALSVMLLVPGAANTVATPYFEKRTVTWSYLTSTGVITGRTSYRVEKPIPFPVTSEGVRNKLGVLDHEVTENQINLTKSYAFFVNKVTPLNLLPYEQSGDYNALRITDAIEAIAALSIINTLQVSLAKSEDSGTNSYSRFANIDWDSIRQDLGLMVQEGINLVDPPENDIEGFTIFFAVSRTDLFPGA